VPARDFSRLSRQIRDASGTDAGARNIAAIQRLIDAIGRGDVDAALREAAPDVVFQIFAPPEFPWIRRAAGVDALRAAITHNFDSVIDQQPEISTVSTQGDTAIFLGRERGRVRETGQAYEMEFVQRFQFRDGQLVNIKIIAAHVT
jgi:ketosteroid isomerase-like protein